MLRGLRKKASLLSSQPLQSDNAKYTKVLKQVHDFEIALEAMDLLLDDRSEEGVTLLNKELQVRKESQDPAAIFPLALGVMEFIEATLGFETEVMARAHKTLSSAEEASLAHSKYNQKQLLATLHIYPPGTEFQVTYAELTLLNALVMLLQENNGMVEQAKALFKLRRAYQILDATYKKIVDSEGAFARNLAKFRRQAETQLVSSVDLPGFSIPEDESVPEDVQLMRNLENVYQMRKRRVEGTNLGPHPSQVNLFESSSLLASSNLSSSLRGPPKTTRHASGSSSLLAERSSLSSLVERSSQLLADRSMGHSVSNLGSKLAANAMFRQDSDSDNDNFSDASETFDEHVPIEDAVPALEYPPSIVSVATSSSSLASDTHLHVLTIDEFIHSGVQLCFGILQVVLLLIPPAIGKVLSIVGFRGDRDTGLRMLWRTAITARNIHGDLALLCLLVFYDGPIQFIDVGFQLPGHDDASVKNVLNLAGRSTVLDSELSTIVKNPNLYTPQLLAKARVFFPHNALWLLQEGRMHAAQGNILHLVQLMQAFTDDPENSIQMEQVEALLTYDRAMFYAFVHDYDQAARDFIRMISINLWSQAVYLFMAGACYLEKWRMIMMGEVTDEERGKDEALAHYAALADKYLKLAPTYVPGHGANAKKKGGIGGSNKQMPFDKFVLRKTRCIEAVHNDNPDIPYIECVGTSLIHELVYFWNGYNRMPQDHLAILHRMLEFSASEHARIPETPDEAMIRHLFQSLALRQQGRVEEGAAIIDDKVIAKYVIQQSPIKWTRMTHSPYLYPTALYERAMFTWMLTSPTNASKAVTDTIEWLERAETVLNIGDYELSNRTSMRIKAATERLEQLKTEIR